ncbi:hypothetical protein L6R46_20145 [Myxococcota bacterium]|nr:hypothetical protein [Myxococcota bacterium]
MPRIKLIVTGDLERAALKEALCRAFPAERDGEDVTWDTPRKVNEVTTHPLPEGGDPSTAMGLLAAAIIEEAITGKKKGQAPADLVLAVCDVELGNLGREGVIVEHLRRALEKKLDRYEEQTRARYRAVLRDRCSFHLLKPMVEAVLFGERAALERAGVAEGVQPRLRVDDVEEFESDDPLWAPTCEVENRKKVSERKEWWRHERHPKHYLDHLLIRSGAAQPYEETEQGAAALRSLHWPTVTNTEPSPFLRALFDDLAGWFGVSSPLGPGMPSSVTSLTPKSPRDRWLRNL